MRQRYIFQIRIPDAVSAHFAGRTMIRIHLGNIPHDEAVARATQLATHYKTLFIQQKGALKKSGTVQTRTRPDTLIRLQIDAKMASRFIATWKMKQSTLFKQRLNKLRDAPTADWDKLEQELLNNKKQALECLRRHNLIEFKNAVSTLESELSFRLEGSENAVDDFALDFNSAHVAFVSECLGVLAGNQAIRSLFPQKNRQLPLVELWGDPASYLPEHWQESIQSREGYVNPKTLNKYKNIASDLGFILTRRPVQSITKADIDALKVLWRNRGNETNTIDDKLKILRTQIRPFDQGARIQTLITETVSVGAPAPRAKRLPFSKTQLCAFIQAISASNAITMDDEMLFYLMLLTGARLEELYQLQAADITPKEGGGWTLRIADHRQTGQGVTVLKNATSSRHLPLLQGVLPSLDAWLAARLESDGYIFIEASHNQYGDRGAAASKRLNTLLRKMFPDDRRLVLQSTRNTISQVMRRAEIDPRVRRRFLGHADRDIHDRHYDPGELLDGHDLESASVAIAAFIRGALGV